MVQDEINLLKQQSPANIDCIDFNQNFIYYNYSLCSKRNNYNYCSFISLTVPAAVSFLLI